MTRWPGWTLVVAAALLLGAAARAQSPDPDAGTAAPPATELEAPAPEAAIAEEPPTAPAAIAAEPPAQPPAPAAATTVQSPAPAPPPRRAAPPGRVSLSESLLAAYHLGNGNIAPRGSPAYDPTGSNYADWLNRLQLDLSWGDLTAQIRVDSAAYANAPVARETDLRLTQQLLNRYNNRLDFEKVFLTWSSRHLDVTLGDTYATFGRGLVLSLRKVDEFGIDTTVRGLSATGRVAGLTVSALGGWSNIVNVDPSTARSAEDPNDAILGARAEYRVGKWITPGVNISHVIYSQNAQVTVPQAERDQVTSVSGSLNFPALSRFGTLYAEFAAQRRLTQGSSLWSTALYANASAYLGPVTLLLEVKDYRNYSTIPTSLDPTQAPELALSDFYSAAPTLERVQQLVLNNTDVTGAHVRGSLKLRKDFIPFVSMAGFVDRTYQTRIYDPYAGAEVLWNDAASRASVSGGYRLNQYAEGSVDPGQPFQEAWHVEFDVSQHLTGPWGAELSGLHLSHRDAQGPNYLSWNEGQVYLSLKRAGVGSVALGYEYYTEAPQSIRPHYVSASGTLNLVKNLLVRLFVGGQRAGIKCVNGVCRNYPGFDGVRLEVQAKY